MHGGFIDLRVTTTHGDDSVWPSFTDIMTVIVMIFLLTLVVIMFRNFELVRELDETITERAGILLTNQNLVRQKAELEGLLARSQSEHATVKNALAAAQQRNVALAARENELAQAVTAATQDKKRAEAALATARTEAQNLTQQLRATTTQLTQAHQQQRDSAVKITRLATAAESLRSQLTRANEQLVTLDAQTRTATGENAALSQQLADAQARFVELSGEYDGLDEKYQKLIRPARSVKEKYVVEIWVEKNAEQFAYRLREPNQATATVTREELHQQLQTIKSQHGQTLYTKIIIPDDSNLLHHEAWEFTREILQKYDYYYQ